MLQSVSYSQVLPVLLYAAEVWSPKFLDQIEVVQTVFFHKFLALQPQMSNYFLQIECQRHHLYVKAVNRALNFYKRINNLPQDRFPAWCMDSLQSQFMTHSWLHRWQVAINDHSLTSPVDFICAVCAATETSWRNKIILDLKDFSRASDQTLLSNSNT
jgi:hypothetical protein